MFHSGIKTTALAPYLYLESLVTIYAKIAEVYELRLQSSESP